MLLISNSIFILLLFYNSFSLVFSEGCTYQEEKDGAKLITNGSNIFSEKEKESISLKKKKCFEYSYSVVFQQKCCYDSIHDECTSDNRTSVNKNISCPEPTSIPNNCGMAGIFQPADATSCTEISLVGGYCCYIDFGRNGKSCIKTNKLNDEKNTATEMMEQYISKYNNNTGAKAIVSNVICDSYNLKIASRILLIGLLLMI